MIAFGAHRYNDFSKHGLLRFFMFNGHGSPTKSIFFLRNFRYRCFVLINVVFLTYVHYLKAQKRFATKAERGKIIV